MKGVMIYKSKYGATRQYAQWLRNELQLPARQPNEISIDYFSNCDFIIIGSPVYIGKLMIRNWLKKHEGILQHKKLFLFIVCATPPTEKEKLDVIVKNNVPSSILDQTTIYFLHGKMVLKGLSRVDRFMLKMGARLEKDPKTKKEMLTDFDAVKMENIAALVKEVKAFSSKAEVAV